MEGLTDKDTVADLLMIATSKGSKVAKQYFKRINEGNDWSPVTVVRMCCFTHDFAKAFWGEEQSVSPTVTRTGVGQYSMGDQKDYEYHLQKMVLCKNPIDYLRKFV